MRCFRPSTPFVRIRRGGPMWPPAGAHCAPLREKTDRLRGAREGELARRAKRSRPGPRPRRALLCRGHSAGAQSKQGNETDANFAPRAAAGGGNPLLLICTCAPDGRGRQGPEVSKGKFLETVGFGTAFCPLCRCRQSGSPPGRRNNPIPRPRRSGPKFSFQ